MSLDAEVQRRPPPHRAADLRFKTIEQLHRTSLPADTPAVLRLDGRAFHTYCRGLDKPFDSQFMADMDATAVHLMSEISGVVAAYVQSDEISLILPAHPERMYGGQIQKLVSVAAGEASAMFNLARQHTGRLGTFDARAFPLADAAEVVDYLAWRQHDAFRNSLSMIAETHFSPKELHGLSTRERHERLLAIGVDPDADVPAGFRSGRLVLRQPRPGTVTYTHRRTGEEHTVSFVRMVATPEAAPSFADGEVAERLSGLVEAPDGSHP